GAVCPPGGLRRRLLRSGGRAGQGILTADLAAAHRDLAEWDLEGALSRVRRASRPGNTGHNWFSTACVGRAWLTDSAALVAPGDVPKWWRDVHVGSPRPRRGQVATQAPVLFLAARNAPLGSVATHGGSRGAACGASAA